MTPFLIMVVAAVIVVVLSIRAATTRQRAMMSQAVTAVQSYSSAAAGARVHSRFTGIPSDGTPMSPQGWQASHMLAQAGFASTNGNAGGTAQFTNGMGVMSLALGEQVRAQLDQQGFGKLGESVAQQMQGMGNGNVTISVDSASTQRHTVQKVVLGRNRAAIFQKIYAGKHKRNQPIHIPLTELEKSEPFPYCRKHSSIKSAKVVPIASTVPPTSTTRTMHTTPSLIFEPQEPRPLQ